MMTTIPDVVEVASVGKIIHILSEAQTHTGNLVVSEAQRLQGQSEG